MYARPCGAGDVRLTGAGEPQRVTGVPVTEGFVALLGVRPSIGRDFTAGECRWGAGHAILSHAFWQRRPRRRSRRGRCAVAMLAGSVPARDASRIDPVLALRSQ